MNPSLPCIIFILDLVNFPEQIKAKAGVKEEVERYVGKKTDMNTGAEEGELDEQEVVVIFSTLVHTKYILITNVKFFCKIFHIKEWLRKIIVIVVTFTSCEYLVFRYWKYENAQWAWWKTAKYWINSCYQIISLTENFLICSRLAMATWAAL